VEKILLDTILVEVNITSLIGDFDNALNQFQFALSLSGNSFQTSETIMTKIKLARERLGRGRGF
jgi:hypothetical protein